MSIEDQRQDATEPRASKPNDLDDTQPSTPVPMAIRSMRGQGESQNEPVGDAGSAPDQKRASHQDTTFTTASLPRAVRTTLTENRAHHSSRALKLVVGLCLVLSLLSLALTAFLLHRLLNVRQTTTQALDRALNAVDTLEGNGFRYEFHFERTLPISAEVPIDQELVIPFEGAFPIDTTVEVPINAGLLGTIVVEVPIDTSIYVKTEVPVRVAETFHISTTIPVSVTLPVYIPPDDPGLQDLLGQLREWLMGWRESF